MDEIFVRSADVPWEQSEELPANLKRKILRRGGDGRPRVGLVKLEPGFEAEGHSHDHAENHYVLEGMYESLGREFPAGSYHFIPKSVSHGPFRSASGALILVVWGD